MEQSLTALRTQHGQRRPNIIRLRQNMLLSVTIRLAVELLQRRLLYRISPLIGPLCPPPPHPPSFLLFHQFWKM